MWNRIKAALRRHGVIERGVSLVAREELIAMAPTASDINGHWMARSEEELKAGERLTQEMINEVAGKLFERNFDELMKLEVDMAVAGTSVAIIHPCGTVERIPLDKLTQEVLHGHSKADA